MSQNPETPSTPFRAAADEAAPAAGNSQEGAVAFAATPWCMGWQAESTSVADRWSFRLLA
jgi:hypothetical protein